MTCLNSGACTLEDCLCCWTQKLVCRAILITDVWIILSLSSSWRIAGKDATETFFGLHRQEVLEKAQYKRLIIGSIAGQERRIFPRAPGALSIVPYAEPTWLTPGYFSPYYKDVSVVLNISFPLAQIRFHSIIASSKLQYESLSRMFWFLTLKRVRKMANGLLSMSSMKWANWK